MLRPFENVSVKFVVDPDQWPIAGVLSNRSDFQVSPCRGDEKSTASSWCRPSASPTKSFALRPHVVAQTISKSDAIAG